MKNSKRFTGSQLFSMAFREDRPEVPLTGEVSADFTVRIALPYLLPLRDGIYPVHQLDGESANVRLERTTRIIGKPDGDGPQVAFSFPTGDLVGAEGFDLPGMPLAYTIATVLMHATLDHDPDDDDLREVQGAAFRAIRRLVDGYRFLSRDVEVEPLTTKQFFEIRAGKPLVLRAVINCGEKKFSDTYLALDPQRPIQGPPEPLDQDFHTRLIAGLTSGEEPPLPGLLMVDASAALARGQTREALLDASAALDVITAQQTIALLERRGEHAEQAEVRVEGRTTKQLVLRILSAHLGAELTESSQWVVWDTTVRPLRNDAVHNGRGPSVLATRDALRAIADLMRLLDVLCARTTNGS
jgi:hypothetical protein